jgi:phosphoribosylanthranilate isomerase
VTTAVKICGINDAESYAAAVDAGADWVGFVFYPPSPRFIGPNTAGILARRHPDGPRRVGLFVNPVPHDIAAVLFCLRLDALQLYCDAERAVALRKRFDIETWRALGVARASELPLIAEPIDRYVIEAKPPEGADRPGGNAASIDWRITRRWRAPLPWLLAGGLTPDNVAEAIATSGATAVDVSSGVETQPGRKDPDLIRSFIAAAKQSPA